MANAAEDPLETSRKELLRILNLERYYPQKLGYKEAIKLQGMREDDSQFGLTIVRKLLELDHRAVQIVTAKINKGKEDGDTTCKESDKTTKSFQFGGKKTEKSSSKVHPMDLMVAVFNCCTNFLRQILVEKMLLCRLSIPLLLPLFTNDSQHIMLHWALKPIFPESKRMISKDVNQSMIDIPNPIISFIRVGNLDRSKSKLLNIVLNQSHHDTFYHRDCLNGSVKRQKSNGSIEAAWFISDEKSDFNSEFFTVLNLRGDSKDHRKQTRFLCEWSSLVVVMADSLDSLKKIYHELLIKFDFATTRILLAFVSKASPEIFEEECSQFLETSVMYKQIVDVIADWTDGRHMNEDEWKESVKNAIKKFMMEPVKEERTLTSLITSSRFKRDCEGTLYEEAKGKAEDITNLIIGDKFRHSKTTLCPLQGKPWIRLSELEREQRRKIKNIEESPEKFTARINKEMKNCRQDQIEMILSLNEPMKRFCESIVHFTEVPRLCFLILTKLSLDQSSRQVVPILTKKCYAEMDYSRKLLESSNGGFEDKAVAAEKQLSEASIGLEHIIREMGQIYEAFQTQSSRIENVFNKSPITKEEIKKYPAIIARLLLEGQPLEIMDGDACNVPLIWLKAVFDEIEKLIGKDKKVFVLSIIGVQSSGKSTFLNALFGLQFPVSAGRCTRGIYCHLVPIDTATFPHDCDYILVVDSEGLRAPEFAGRSIIRDNELATLTVGLADVTIVNMKGESFSDMEDILQIVVHALIRIKQTKKDLKFMPSCVFVHQNVAAADAEEKIQMGKMKVLSFLDKMAQAAAHKEGVKDVTGFRDVINYEDNFHSWYMPDLWSGQPPMATVNTEYGRKVSDVKQSLLQMVINKPQRLTISQFYWRMSDLWIALLHENFVICFKNTPEILAHRSLDARITQAIWDMKNGNCRRRNVINNKVMSCETVEDLIRIEPEVYEELKEVLDDSLKKANVALERILNEGEYKEILEQSREKYEKAFQIMSKSENSRAYDETRRILAIHKMKLENCKDIRDFEIKLKKAVQTDVDDLKRNKTKLHGKKLDDHFNEKWQQWTIELSNNYKKSLEEGSVAVKIAIESALESVLVDYIESCDFKQALQKYPITTHFKKDVFKEMPPVTDIDIDEGGYNDGSAKEVHQKSFITEANNICREVLCRVKLLIDEELIRVNFDLSFVDPIIIDVGKFFGINREPDSVNRRNSQGDKGDCGVRTPGFKFKKRYVVQFLLVVGQYVFKRVNQFRQELISKTEPMVDIEERYRPQLKTLFCNYLSQTSPVVTAADILANVIVSMVKRAVMKDLGRLILEKIGLSDKDVIFKSKHSFLTRILTDLGEKGGFLDYIAYLETPENYFKEKIKILLEESLLKETKHDITSSAQELPMNENIDTTSSSVLLDITTNNLEVLVKDITTHLIYAKANCSENVEVFLTTFQETLQGKLLFQKNDYRLILELDIGRLDVFTEIVIEKIEVLKDEAVTYYREAKGMIWNELQRSEIDPIKELLDKILGCREKCPFCSAPCSATTKYHADSHRANHYPMGVGGTIDVPSIFEDVMETDNVAVRYTTNFLVLDTCHSLVDSEKQFRSPATLVKYSKWWHRAFNWNYHPYNKYKQVYPAWDIPVDRSMNASLYWKWFMARFEKNLAIHYRATCPEIPQAWKDITREEALKSLKSAT